MTKQDLLKYAGKKTFGKNNELLTNGVIVGFDANDDNECLVARFENGDVSGAGWSISSWEITFFTEKEEEIYKSGKGCYLFAKIDNVIMDEQKEFDLTKILKGCEGMVFYSTMVGYCRLIDVNEFITIGYGDEDFVVLESDGKFSKDGECTVFPSKENRDWSTFKKPIKVNDDDWVVCCDKNDTGVIIQYGCINMSWKYIIPYDKFRPDLTEEDLKKLSIV